MLECSNAQGLRRQRLLGVKTCFPSRLPTRSCSRPWLLPRLAGYASPAAVCVGARLHPARGAGVPLRLSVRRSALRACSCLRSSPRRGSVGPGPGFIAAVLATLAVPQLIAVSYPLLGGFLDLPRFTTFSIAGLAVGWWSFRRRQVETALRASEERYGLAMEAAGDGHTDWNLETGEHYISLGLLKICGYAPGTTFRDRPEWVRRFPFHPEDRPKWEAAVGAHFASHESHFKMELRIVVLGEVRWLWTRGKVTRDAEGRARRRIGVVADITARKVAEEALRQSEERYALAVAGSYDGVWDIDFVARSVFFSARTRELCGLPPGPEVVPWMDGSRLCRSIPTTCRGGRPRCRRTCRERRRRTRASSACSSPTASIAGATSTASVCAMPTASRCAWPARSATSTPAGAPRRRCASPSSATSSPWPRASRDTGTGTFPPTGIYASPRAFELAGYPARNHVRSTREEYRAQDQHAPGRLREMGGCAGGVVRRNGRAAFHGSALHRRGETRWHILQAICRRDDTGKVIRWAGSATDITARKHAEEALRESEQRYELAMAASESGYWDWHVPTNRYCRFAESVRTERVSARNHVGQQG